MNRLTNLVPGRLLIAGLGLVLVAMAALAAGYLTRTHSEASLMPPAASSGSEIVRGLVQSVSSDSVTLQTESGPVTLKITPSTARETMQQTSVSSIKPGDWVNAGGVRHAQTLFVVNALVVIPDTNLEAGR